MRQILPKSPPNSNSNENSFLWKKGEKSFSPRFNLIVISKRKSQTKLQTNILKYFFGKGEVNQFP